MNDTQNELIVATPDWEEAAATPTVIDEDEYYEACEEEFVGSYTEQWSEFCDLADEYVRQHRKGLV